MTTEGIVISALLALLSVIIPATFAMFKMWLQSEIEGIKQSMKVHREQQAKETNDLWNAVDGLREGHLEIAKDVEALKTHRERNGKDY